MRHLVIDGMNFAYRANVWRPGTTDTVEYLFFRNLRALIEQHDPDHVWYVLEGYPKARHVIDPGYKGNRILEPGNPEIDKRRQFMQEIREARALMAQHLPISCVRQPDWECDDMIYNLIKKGLQNEAEVIVASSDNDFIQLLQEFTNVRIYASTKKAFLEAPEYPYLVWKALRGDGSDNVKGIKGAGEKTAPKLAADPALLMEFLQEDDRMERFERNLSVMKFHDFDEDERSKVEHMRGVWDPGFFQRHFHDRGYKSMLVDSYWSRFVGTFDKLHAKP